MKRREERSAKIREAKRVWKPRPAPRRKTTTPPRQNKLKREAEGRKRRAQDPPRSTPRPRTRRTDSTDAEAKVMKQSDKGFDYSYNAKAVVIAPNRSRGGGIRTNEANDKQQAVPMAKRPWTT